MTKWFKRILAQIDVIARRNGEPLVSSRVINVYIDGDGNSVTINPPKREN